MKNFGLITLLLFTTGFAQPTGSDLAVAQEQDLGLGDDPVQTEEVKFFGDYLIGSEQVNYDKVRIVGGDLTISGRAEGQYTVIGGNVIIKDGAIINGRIVAIGGTVHRSQAAQINGRIIETNLSQGLSYKETFDESGQNELEGDTDFELKERSWYARKSWIHPKRQWFAYNRNEGLLITPFNFRWDRRSLSNLRLNLSAGWRFSQDDFAGRLTVETYLINRRIILFGSAFKEARTDDYYRLPELENSLAGILARQDFYDRWDETGYAYGVGLDLSWIRLMASYNNVEQDSISVDHKLWSVFNDSRGLRDNPLITPGNVESIRLSFAFRPKNFNAFKSGVSLYATAEQTLSTDIGDNYQRLLAMATMGIRLTPGVILRNRVLAGYSSGDLPEFRYFSVGGLGSISGYPFKLQQGDHFAQINTEVIFTGEFLDGDWALILFADGGNAWQHSDYTLGDINSIISNGKSSAGIGFTPTDDDDIDLRFNIARPLDGTDYWETTLRINLNF